MRLISPHISRIFTAVAVWSLLIVLVLFNIALTKTNPLAYSSKLYDVLTHPFSAAAHERLAQALWGSGARAFAKQELAITSELSPVLGTDTTTREEREKNEMRFWENTIVTHPDYRDAYIQLASLSYAQGNLTKTKEYLTRAAALDPNGKSVGNLLGFVSTLLLK